MNDMVTWKIGRTDPRILWYNAYAYGTHGLRDYIYKTSE